MTHGRAEEAASLGLSLYPFARLPALENETAAVDDYQRNELTVPVCMELATGHPAPYDLGGSQRARRTPPSRLNETVPESRDPRAGKTGLSFLVNRWQRTLRKGEYEGKRIGTTQGISVSVVGILQQPDGR